MDDLIQTITRLRRATTNRDVLAVCDALEGYLLVKPAPVSTPEQVRQRFDKKTYQRMLMRERRALAKLLKPLKLSK